MDFLWTPWRFRYMAGTREATSTGVSAAESCIFCEMLEQMDDAAAHILLRAERNFVVLNAFPYTAGHLMIVTLEHVGELAACDPETLAEMMRLAQRMTVALQRVYAPNGFNLGMNLGRAAGAGVAGHLHLHLVPRWVGDTNFMTVTGETRLVPEDLDTTYNKLRRELGLSVA
jgi:ATP adenylyltransferase